MRSNNNNLQRATRSCRALFSQYRLPSPRIAGAKRRERYCSRYYRIVLRRHHDPDAPPAHLRHHRALSQFGPASLAPRALLYAGLDTEYLHGVVNLPARCRRTGGLTVSFASTAAFCQRWRIAPSPLLAQYWSLGDPARRTPFWLRRLKQLQKTVNLARCGSRLCIWMSMATI